MQTFLGLLLLRTTVRHGPPEGVAAVARVGRACVGRACARVNGCGPGLIAVAHVLPLAELRGP